MQIIGKRSGRKLLGGCVSAAVILGGRSRGDPRLKRIFSVAFLKL